MLVKGKRRLLSDRGETEGKGRSFLAKTHCLLEIRGHREMGKPYDPGRWSKAARKLLAGAGNRTHPVSRARTERHVPDAAPLGNADHEILPLAEEFSINLNILFPLVGDL